jgi:hypothetical protein
VDDVRDDFWRGSFTAWLYLVAKALFVCASAFELLEKLADG